MIRQGHFIAVVGAFLMGCAVLVMAGCAGVRSEASQKEEQGHAEAKASEEARCEGTRTYKKPWKRLITTNDVPGCPNGGLLSGTDKADDLDGLKGDDAIHGLGGVDHIDGGDGRDVIYAGPGDDYGLFGGRGDDVIYGGDGNDEEVLGWRGDDVIYGGDGNDYVTAGQGEDVLYGGKGNDSLDSIDGSSMRAERWSPMRDELYCGEGEDHYTADKLDYVDSSCEKKVAPAPPVF